MQPPLKCHFLVIENNPDEAFLIERAFGKAPHLASVFICRDVSEAISYLRGVEMYRDRVTYPLPHAIISDLHMTGESGLDFLRWLRAETKFKTLPFIILTGSSAPEHIREAFALGANKVLEKPPTLPALTAMIKTLVQEWCHPDIEALS